MDFDFQWLLLGLPVAFALGWLASRIDLRQWRSAQRESPRAYFKGLNLLLNEQQDKAIDAFIEAVQHDPDTTELHFALGNLFRRRGEYERAVRVHEHLLSRGDLPRAERERAQYALAQDFLKAGLFDRAEAAYQALENTRFRTDAWLALLTLYERSRDWGKAIEVARKLEDAGAGSFSNRIAHCWCEIALDADARGDAATADEALAKARAAMPQAARPLVIAGQRLARQDRHAEALQVWNELITANPGAFALVAREYAASATAARQQAAAIGKLRALYERAPSVELLAALRQLEADPVVRRDWLGQHLARQPSISAALDLLDETIAQGQPLSPQETQRLQQVLAQSAKPLQRYRCAACGFEASHYFWQCPGCQSWDSYPPRRIEDY
ncbi:lipopolysaccharide assembly protein LapB [Caldimonas thermodepolymerans]|uniref:Lipopolysaccharide assembly protein B n=1 Tax=Caldimonas thermodepolymerans TaxID=215580 RepID=A0A2S5T376_9BURK|nr:lipopolysaccharide assembly protein LapB [Caldimonas thermodepolymerans]PPE69406.1 lipopolysaccharide assembly protein LapB [Caldimonas thermodepolymerans]QPC32756.1 lipopolysaccharide assembly protein LapB [Caldimonas thermodepolymerans]RDI03519.1 lipopolysaccharide biosynthesis regulator YciM [Caldimonas thermodepolymerans]TCP06622.1 lipopolysaccharide biosynthesis regulator YciM [Caldimonas thermodepolymerans]UZG45565.1 lipopolysaccharide assembly protein LapB [Caldimonas thermodepolymer